MMTGSELGWRLRILAAGKAGCGFVVTPGVALTCAHVVDGQSHCHVVPLDGRAGSEGLLCPATPVSPKWDIDNYRWPDIARIDLPTSGSDLAPLGTLVRPVPGSVVDVLGFPDGFEAEGQRVRARVTGDDASGHWMQLDGLHLPDGRIAQGFSGAAALDVTSRRVVGMVVWAAADAHTKISWLIPLDTIATFWPPLRGLLPSPLAADPDFTTARHELDGGFYPAALQRIVALANRHRAEPLVYYYWALAGLGGVRPAQHGADTIAGVERLLRSALWLDPDAAHVAALWAVLKDDYFVLRGMHPGDPPIPYLTSFVLQIRPDHAAEILRHVPAVGSATWQTISRRRFR